MITITIESESQTFKQVFPGDSFRVSGDDTERIVRPSGTGAAVSLPKPWIGQRCVAISLSGTNILTRTQEQEPQNERELRGIE